MAKPRKVIFKFPETDPNWQGPPDLRKYDPLVVKNPETGEQRTFWIIKREFAEPVILRCFG